MMAACGSRCACVHMCVHMCVFYVVLCVRVCMYVCLRARDIFVKNFIYIPIQFAIFKITTVVF